MSSAARLLCELSIFVFISAAVAVEPNPKAMRYYSVLVKRPSPGYLFDRFYNTWLDTATLADLEEFLVEQVEKNKRTADRLLLAFFHAKQGSDVRALAQFRTALADDPGNAVAWFHKAEVEVRTLSFDTAIADLERAKQTKPDAKLALQIVKLQGRILVRNHQPDKAIAIWKKLLAANPDDEELHEDIIELEIDEGLHDEAAELCEQLIRRAKDKYQQVLRRIRLGDIHQRAARRPKALEIYSATLEQVGHGSWLEREIVAQIEQLFRQQDNLTGLKSEYTKLLKAYPRRIHLHQQSARLLVQLGENEAAVKQFEQILAITPGDRANQEAFVKLLADTGNLKRAMQIVESLIKQHPQDAELSVRLATLHHSAGDRAAASAALRHYIDVSDKDEYAYLRAARLLHQFELFDEAEQTFRELTVEFPDSIAARESMAAFLFDRDKKVEARAIWKELAVGQDRSQVVRIARILAARNEHQAAFELLEARHDEFSDDPIFLGQLVAEAISVDRFKEALPWARRRVRLSRTASDLETAIAQASRVITKADAIEEVMKSLRGQAQRSVQQTCLLAELHEQIGDSAVADRILSKSSDNPLIVGQQIRLHTRRYDWTNAANATARLIEMPGGRKTANIQRLVDLHQKDMNYEASLHWFEEWKKVSPGSTLPWIKQARLLVLRGQPDRSIEVLRKAVARFDGDPDLRNQLASAYTNAGKLADAERMYWLQYEQSETLRGKMSCVAKLANLAQFWGTTRKLIEAFEERQRTNRRSVEPLLALAEIHRTNHNYEGRRKALLEATRIRSEDHALLREIARIEEAEGDWQRALATLERAAKLDKSTRTREAIARIQLKYGDANLGYAMLYELAGGAKSNARNIEAIAGTMMSVQDWERAAEFLAPLVPRFADDYRLQFLLAIAQEEADQQAASIENFLQLLTMEKEIPGLPSAVAQQNVWHNNYIAQISNIVPRESLDFFRFFNNRRYAFQYRRISHYYSSQYVSSIRPFLPPNVEAARSFAVSHLLAMAKYLDEPQQRELIAAMKDRGVANANVLAELPESRYNWSGWPGLLEKHPTDVGLAAYWVLEAGGSHTAECECNARCVELFKRSHPQLAVIAAVHARVSDEAHEALFAEAMKLILRIEKPSYQLVSSLAGAFTEDRHGRPQPTPLAPEKRLALNQLLVAWYPKLSNQGNQQHGLFPYVGRSLLASEDMDAYAKLLDEEIVRWRTVGKAVRQQYQASNRFIEPIAFPSKMLTNFPDYLIQRDDRRWDEGKLAKLVSLVKDPTLKILLAHKAEQSELIRTQLGEMLADSQPSLDAYLLAAGWASREEKFDEAAGLLDKARFLVMPLEMRQRIDSALVAMAWLADKPADESGDPSDKRINELGRAAALRLRRARLEPRQRAELIVAMEDLGLTDEAASLEEVAARSQTQVRSVQIRQPDDITQMIADGKRNQAIREITNSLATPARIATMRPGTLSNAYQIRQLADVTEKHRLTDAVLARFEPGDVSTPRRQGAFGVVCEILGKKDRARAVYEQLIADQPKNDAIRFRLVLLCIEAGDEAAYEHLNVIEPKIWSKLATTATDEFIQQGWTFDQRFMLAEMIERLLVERQDLRQLDLSWVVAFLDKLAGQQYVLDNSLHAMYYGWGQFNKLADNMRETNLRRRKIHDRLCRAMINVPQLAPFGFTRLLAVAERYNQVYDEHAELARQAIINYRPRQTRSQFYASLFPRGGPVFGADETKLVRFRTPTQFLIRRAEESGTVEATANELAEILVKSNQSKAASELRDFAALYSCQPADFVKRAEAYIKRKQKTNQFGSQTEQEMMLVVIDAWDERGLSVDLSPVLKKQLVAHFTSSNNSHSPAFVEPIAVGIARRSQQPEQIVDFLQLVTTSCMGTKEKWPETIEKHFDAGGWSGRSLNSAMHGLGAVLHRLEGHDELTFHVLNFVFDNHLVRIVEGLEGPLRYRAFNAKPDHFERAWRLLESSPFFEDFENFRAYSLATGQETILGRTLKWMRGDYEEARRERFVEKLSQRATHTFGSRFMLAALGDDPSKSIPAIMSSYVDRLKSSPKERQTEFVSLIAELAPPHKAREHQLSAAAEQLYDWVEAMRGDHMDAIVKRILAAKRPSDLSVRADDIQAPGEEVLPHLIHSNRDMALKVYWKLVELSERFRTSGNSHSIYRGETDAGRLLRDVVRGPAPMVMHAFAIDVMTRNDRTPVESRDWWLKRMNQSFEKLYLEQLDAVPLGANRRFEAVKKLYESLGTQLGQRPTTLFVEGYWNVCDRLRPGELEQVIDWADEQAASGKYPAIAQEIAAAARLQVGRISNPSINPLSQQTDGLEIHPTEYYLSILRDTKLPPTWRTSVAWSLIKRHPTNVPRDLVLQSAEVYTEAMSSGAVIPHMQSPPIVSSLLAVDRDDKWKKVALALAKAWNKRNLTTATRHPAFGFSINANNRSEPLEFLKLNFLLDQQTTAVQFVQTYEKVRDIANDPSLIGLLVAGGRDSMAARMLRSRWNMLKHVPNEPAVYYDRQLHKQMPAFVESIPNEDMRYLAEVLLVSLPDSPLASEKHSQDQSDRLAAIANRFSNTEFTDVAIRDRALLWLSRDPAVRQHVREPLAKIASETDLLAWLTGDKSLAETPCTLAARHLAMTL